MVRKHISLNHYSDICILLAHLAYVTWLDIRGALTEVETHGRKPLNHTGPALHQQKRQVPRYCGI